MAETEKAQNLENQTEDISDTVSNASRSSKEENPNVRRSYKEEVDITKLQHNNINCVEEPLLKFVDNRKNLKEDSIYVKCHERSRSRCVEEGRLFYQIGEGIRGHREYGWNRR